MNTRPTALALLIVAVLATEPSAAEPTKTAEPRPATIAAPGRAVDRSRLSPMHRDIADAVEAEKARVEELNRRYLTSSLLAERLAIQKQIEAIKQEGLLTALGIQLRYAELEGRSEVATQLRTTIEAIRNPKSGPAAGALRHPGQAPILGN
jgi:hypothetical protein